MIVIEVSQGTRLCKCFIHDGLKPLRQSHEAIGPMASYFKGSLWLLSPSQGSYAVTYTWMPSWHEQKQKPLIASVKPEQYLGVSHWVCIGVGCN
jgi:hypothetical protein